MWSRDRVSRHVTEAGDTGAGYTRALYSAYSLAPALLLVLYSQVTLRTVADWPRASASARVRAVTYQLCCHGNSPCNCSL